MKDHNRFYIRTLSPVHIGCDEVYEPMGFVVDERMETLTAFDPLDFFKNLSPHDKTRFADICRKGTIGSLLKLNQFMQGKIAVGHRVKACRGFIGHYKKNLDMNPSDEKKIQNELNKFSIHRTAFHEHTNQPYIPGSSIKGALRTAYLNILAKDNGSVSYDQKDKKASQMLEKRLLLYDQLENDPFRLLKVSDFVMVQAATKIVYAVNEKKKSSKFSARGPYQILEIIEPGSVFTGTIAVEERYAKEAGIKRPLTREVVLKSASLFYGNEKRREEEELKLADLPFAKMDNLDGSILIRVGRHSGAESVTIEGHRNIKIMGNRGQNSFSPKGATTFWLAADVQANWKKEELQPFGWAVLGKLQEEMIADLEKTLAEEQKTKHHVMPDLISKAPEQENQAVKDATTIEETWEDTFVSFNAGGGGIVTATAKDRKKAEKRIGNDRTLISDDLINRIRKKKGITAKVTVRKHGNAFEIIKVEI